MTISKFAAFALVAGASSAALAQSLSGSSEMAPGLWTTPEITRVCRLQVARTLPVGSDQRQSVMEACVRKAYAQEVAKSRKKN